MALRLLSVNFANYMNLSDTQTVFWQDLGRVGYQEDWDIQEQLLQSNLRVKSEARAAAVPDSPHHLATKHHFLFCEHDPVFTLGKSGDIQNLLLDEAGLAEKGISFFKTNRGGDITFHGPQQIVGYPIFDLEKIYTDIGKYLRNVEEVIIRTIADYGIIGKRSPGETGVWIDPDIKGKERKICAIGVRCSRWVTMHGFALNVNTDLSYFNYIIPCGIENKQVTSIEKELGRQVDMDEVKGRIRKNFEEIFQLRFEALPVA